MSPSIRRRLLVSLLCIVTTAWAATAVTSYLDIYHEIEELFDAELAQSAKLLLAISPHELEEQLLFGGEMPETQNIEYPENIPFGHTYEHKVAFQIWISGDRLAVRSASAPVIPLASNANGFSLSTFDGHQWRVFSVVDNQHGIKVQVGERTDIRGELTNAIALRMIDPLLVLLPLMAIFIWYGVGFALRPMERLASELERRAPTHLDPINVTGVPIEAMPLVRSMNSLFSRVQQAFENERRFTSDASHELRTPLAGLKTQAQVALIANERTAQHYALRQVVAGVDRATHLVEQLLTLARLDPQTDLAGEGPADLCAVANDVLADIAPQALEKRIELILADPCNGTVNGNKDALAILLRNLVDNAIRYTPAEGVVQVQIAPTPAGVQLLVEDSGLGIPEEDRERVFERFYRRLGTEVPGSGLGLSIVGRIAELHRAQITLGDAALGGLSVSVLFPAAAAKAPANRIAP